VLVVGDVMVDVNVASTELAEGGDVAGEVRLHPAGAGANAAVWAAASGVRSRLHGRVGDDLPGRLVAEALTLRGVDARLVVDPAARTGAMLVVRTGDDRSMVADRGANGRWSSSDLPEELAAGAVLVSGYLVLDPGSEPTAAEALRRARSRFVAVDAASWPLVSAFGGRRFVAVTAPANVLLANEREADALAGSSGPDGWAGLLDHFELVVVKRGPRGATAFVNGRRVEVPATPGATVDATGAGDAFDGALLAALAGRAPLEVAVRAGCEAGTAAAASPAPWPAEGPR
jgi:sugar/nucleoside kinase (ribokinase family)